MPSVSFADLILWWWWWYFKKTSWSRCKDFSETSFWGFSWLCSL